MNRKLVPIILVAMLTLLCLSLVACDFGKSTTTTTTPKTFTVTFDSNGGSKVASQTVQKSQAATEPTAPTKTGYTFDGWYLDKTAWDFGTAVTKSITLTAKWSPVETKVTFDTDGGKALNALSYTYGKSYTLPTPQKTDYIFLGWYNKDAKIETTGTWAQDGNAITLTAKWELLSYSITFDTNGGDALAPQKVGLHTGYILPTPEKENFVFKGWLYNGTPYSNKTDVTQDITLVAQWQSVDELFTYTTAEDNVMLTSYIGTSVDVVVPATINDTPVTQIATDVFTDNATIETVTFDGSFENYTQGMFSGCTSLRRLTISAGYGEALYFLFGDGINAIPESFTEINFASNSRYIDASLFKNKGTVCNHVVSYVIPDGTTEIKNGLFKNYTYLQGVIIPDSVTSIGERAFDYCSGLTEITIPDSVTSIGEWAFHECRSLTEITIPDSVTSIGYYAFYDCSGLTSIVIPDSVTSIGYQAFYNCRGLKEVHISDIAKWCSISFGGDDDANPLYYAHNLYLNDTLITDLVIPNSVTSIGSRAFCGCSGFTSIVIPDSVTSIGYGAFPEELFQKKNGLYYVDGWVVGVVDTTITSILWEKETKGIAEEAFTSCLSLTEITIPDGVTSIGSAAFIHCCNLTKIIIPTSVTSIGDSAFYGCNSLTEITIPDGVTSIGYATFVGSSLTEITIPDGVTSIGDGAFFYCSNLTKIIIPTSVTSISNSALACCGKSNVYYKGTSEDWAKIEIEIDYTDYTISISSYRDFTDVPRYYYSETKPTKAGNYWHYDTDGVTVLEW